MTTTNLERKLYVALLEAEDALDTLRRCRELDVGYKLNVVREALATYRRHADQAPTK